MPWSAIPVSAGIDAQQRTTYLELMDAWNECRKMLGQSTVSNPAAGDPCFEAAALYSIKAMQEWIETYCTSFVVSHNAGSPPTLRANGYYDGAATITLYTLATMRSTAGLNASGFTKTSSPTYGIAAAGDNVLKEHFNEVRLALNVLQWTKIVGTLDPHSENDELITISATHASWHAAYLDAAAQWATATAGATSGGTAFAVCFGTYDGTNYQCQLDRLYSYPEFTGIPTGLAHELDIYQAAGLFHVNDAFAVFFKHADDNFRQNLYSNIEIMASATTSTRSGAKVGSLTNPPDEGPAPTNTGGDTASYGWQTRPNGVDEQPVGVARWTKTFHV